MVVNYPVQNWSLVYDYPIVWIPVTKSLLESLRDILKAQVTVLEAWYLLADGNRNPSAE